MKLFEQSFIIAAVLFAAGSASAGEVHLLATNAPASIELHDQYDSPQKLIFPATNITLLTIADRKGDEQVEGWIAALKPRYAGRIRLCGIADVGGAPAFVRGKIRKRFQETRAHPVMMDWSGKVCAQLSYQRDVANILVLGRTGAILGRFSGLADGPNIVAACAVVDQALASPPPIAARPKSLSP
jgi:hypothetical protein